MVNTGDRLYQIERIEHDLVNPDMLRWAANSAIAQLEEDAEKRGFAIDWNTAKLEIASTGFGDKPAHEARITATAL